ncbi:peptidylprolyl isomerase [Lampropedia puyangensis]|uniref:peptidylprolyl isomerase n=1 Tax=Lampropedia puyangensis TaxID=1330072 RepID=UPI0013050A94|nr:peptidylprolyl isomerase [Lampropedia puyangensis]
MNKSSAAALCVALVGVCLVGGAQAQVVVRGKDVPVEITVTDIEADAAVLAPEVRHHALSDSLKIQAAAQGLYVRAALAEEAKKQNLAQSPIAQARLKQAEQKVLMDLLLENVEKTKAPTEADLLKYAQTEYKLNPERFKVPAEKEASHILILGDTPEAQKRINELYQELEKGADFGELAFANSQDQRSAARYGSLGYFAKGKMVPEFEEALDALKDKGAYSKPFKTPFGWHIVRLDDVREAGKLPFDEVKTDLMEAGKVAAIKDLRDNLIQKAAQANTPDEAAIEALAAENKKLADQGRQK